MTFLFYMTNCFKVIKIYVYIIYHIKCKLMVANFFMKGDWHIEAKKKMAAVSPTTFSKAFSWMIFITISLTNIT